MAEPDGRRLVFEDIEMDEDTREVTRAGNLIELTATEYRLLRFFLLHPRNVLSRAQLLDNVWQYDFGGDGRVLETYVSYLRKKLDVHGPPLIHTVRGVGYALRAPR
jgi:two-component system OmpR family response regulator